MKTRSLKDIYPIWHPHPMDADDVARICAQRLHLELSSVDDITSWIERCYENPYDREALAAGIADYLPEHADPSEEDFIYLRTYEREEVEGALRRIIRHAQSDQAVEETNYCDSRTNPTLRNEPSNDIYAHLARLDDYQQRLLVDVNQMKENISLLLLDRTARRPDHDDYIGLLTWLEHEKAIGNDHLKNAQGNRSEMARQLSEELGWVVDIHSLNRAINRRNRKHD